MTTLSRARLFLCNGFGPGRLLMKKVYRAVLAQSCPYNIQSRTMSITTRTNADKTDLTSPDGLRSIILQHFAGFLISEEALMRLWAAYYQVDFFTSYLVFPATDEKSGYDHVRLEHESPDCRIDRVSCEEAMQEVLRNRSISSCSSRQGSLLALVIDAGEDNIFIAISNEDDTYITTRFPMTKSLFAVYAEMWNIPGFGTLRKESPDFQQIKRDKRAAAWDALEPRVMTYGRSGADVPPELISQRVWIVDSQDPVLREGEPGEIYPSPTFASFYHQFSAELQELFSELRKCYWIYINKVVDQRQDESIDPQTALEGFSLHLRVIVIACKLREETRDPVYILYDDFIIEVRNTTIRHLATVIMEDIRAGAQVSDELELKLNAALQAVHLASQEEVSPPCLDSAGQACDYCIEYSTFARNT